jgi:hypothetical protein
MNEVSPFPKKCNGYSAKTRRKLVRTLAASYQFQKSSGELQASEHLVVLCIYSEIVMGRMTCTVIIPPMTKMSPDGDHLPQTREIVPCKSLSRGVLDRA